MGGRIVFAEFAINNGIENVNLFIREIRADAERIQDLVEEIAETGERLETVFRPLNDLEIRYRELSPQKGRIQRSRLRLYAIKIDENLFVITGGTIKITHKMNEHPNTQEELSN